MESSNWRPLDLAFRVARGAHAEKGPAVQLRRNKKKMFKTHIARRRGTEDIAGRNTRPLLITNRLDLSAHQWAQPLAQGLDKEKGRIGAERSENWIEKKGNMDTMGAVWISCSGVFRLAGYLFRIAQ